MGRASPDRFVFCSENPNQAMCLVIFCKKWETLLEFSRLRPGRFTWKLRITHLERKIIFQTSMIMFQPLIFRGVSHSFLAGIPSPLKKKKLQKNCRAGHHNSKRCNHSMMMHAMRHPTMQALDPWMKQNWKFAIHRQIQDKWSI